MSGTRSYQLISKITDKNGNVFADSNYYLIFYNLYNTFFSNFKITSLVSHFVIIFPQILINLLRIIYLTITLMILEI